MFSTSIDFGIYEVTFPSLWSSLTQLSRFACSSLLIYGITAAWMVGHMIRGARIKAQACAHTNIFHWTTIIHQPKSTHSLSCSRVSINTQSRTHTVQIYTPMTDQLHRAPSLWGVTTGDALTILFSGLAFIQFKSQFHSTKSVFSIMTTCDITTLLFTWI